MDPWEPTPFEMLKNKIDNKNYWLNYSDDIRRITLQLLTIRINNVLLNKFVDLYNSVDERILIYDELVKSIIHNTWSSKSCNALTDRFIHLSNIVKLYQQHKNDIICTHMDKTTRVVYTLSLYALVNMSSKSQKNIAFHIDKFGNNEMSVFWLMDQLNCMHSYLPFVSYESIESVIIDCYKHFLNDDIKKEIKTQMNETINA